MAVTEARPAAGRRDWAVRAAPGLTVAVLVAAIATVAGAVFPLVGAPVFGIVLGTLAAAVVPACRGARFADGYAVAGRSVLQLSIVVLGAGLSLRQVVEVGVGSLPVMLGTLTVALGGAWLLGRLIGVGTGICGASAIAATSAVVKPRQADIAYALGTIFTFNIVAVLLFPPLGHLLGMSPHAFGLWAGTAINDTSSVVAASFAYGGDAGTFGVVVKLTRTLTLIPIVIVLAVLRARRSANGHEVSLPWRKIVPVFLLGFLATATLATIGVVPASWHAPLATVATFLITTALAGIGLSLRLSDMRAAGARPLLLGGLLWLAVAASSLGLQAITGTL
jgi:uncharacterized integral membrane protein (TIGR00698 family)